MRERTYRFRSVEACDMCHGTQFRTLGMRMDGRQGASPKSVSGIAVSVKQCVSCELIFADPMPIPQSLSDHYGVPPEEYWQDQDLAEDPHVADAIATARSLLSGHKAPKALDVGAGRGHGMTELQRAGFDAYGIEPSEPFQRRLDQSRVQLAAVEDADFPAESFDLIMFEAILEHLYSPSAALERAFKWLKPGGILFASVPNSRWLIPRLVNRYFWLRGTNFVTHLSPMHVPFHLYEFSVDSFRRNGELLGYEITKAQNDVCHVTYVPGPLKGLFARYMDRTGSGMMLSMFLRRPSRN